MKFFGSRLKGVHEEIYNFHIVLSPRPQNYTRYVYAYKNAVYKFSSKTTSLADRQQFFEKRNEHFHMKINLRAHHYVELFENKFCTATATAISNCLFALLFCVYPFSQQTFLVWFVCPQDDFFSGIARGKQHNGKNFYPHHVVVPSKNCKSLRFYS